MKFSWSSPSFRPCRLLYSFRLGTVVGLSHLFTAAVQAAPPPNDSFAGALVLTGLPVTTTGTNGEATNQPGEPDETKGNGGASVWWSWTAPASGWVEVDTFGSDLDTVLAVYTGSALSNLNLLAWNDEAANSSQSRVKILAVAGTVYRLQIQGWFEEEGAIALSVKTTAAPTPPVLQRLTLTPAMVNVTSGAATMEAEFEFTAPDTLSVFRLEFTAPSGDLLVRGGGLYSGSLISGTPKGGVFRFPLHIPSSRISGSWQIKAVLLDEDAGEVYYGGAGNPPMPAGSTASITLVNTGGVDVSPPQITAATVTPNPVNVTGGRQTVTFRLTASDDVAVSDLSVNLQEADTFNHRGYFSLTDADRISGTAQSGVWEKTFAVPPFSAPGTWEISYFINDGSDRYQDYTEGGDPVPPAIQTILTVQNTGPVDYAGPLLTSASTDVNTIDLSNGGQTVTFNATLLDSLAGLRSAYVSLYSSSGAYLAGGSLFFQENAPHPVVATSVSTTVFLPGSLPAGTHFWSVSAFDSAENSAGFGRDGGPFPGGFSGSLTVINGGASDAYATWRTARPGLAGDAGMPGADPDGDGLPNAVEFLLGTDPLLRSQEGGSDPNAARAPVYTLTPSHLQAAYHLSAANAALGSGNALSLQPQSTPNGSQPWQNLTPVVVAGDLWRVEIPLQAGEKQFLRFAVFP